MGEHADQRVGVAAFHGIGVPLGGRLDRLVAGGARDLLLAPGRHALACGRSPSSSGVSRSTSSVPSPASLRTLATRRLRGLCRLLPLPWVAASRILVRRPQQHRIIPAGRGAGGLSPPHPKSHQASHNALCTKQPRKLPATADGHLAGEVSAGPR
jgi:hypothetical protein